MDGRELSEHVTPIRSTKKQAVGRQSIRLLLVEDNHFEALYFSRLLAGAAREHFETERVETLAQALAHLERSSPDVILLDLTLADSSGLATFEAVYAQAPYIPILVITGCDDEELASRCMQAGAQDYLVKTDRDRHPGLPHQIRYAIERKRQELRLRESEERFRRLAENAPDIIFRYRLMPIPGYEYVSPAATTITGYTPEAYYANPTILFDTLLHPDDRHLFPPTDPQAWLTDQPLTVRFVRKDGRTIWVEQHLIPLHDEAGHLIAMEGIVRDVDDRQRAVEGLRKSEERFAKIVRTSPVPIAVISLQDRRLLDINASGLAMIGYSREEALGRTANELGVWGDPAQQAKIAQAVLEGISVSREIWFRTRSGRRIHVLASFETIELDGEPCLLAIINDITERKQMELALQERTEELKERVKELQCLFAITNLIETRHLASYDVLQAIAKLIPFGWWHPERTSACISYRGQRFCSEMFAETPHRLTDTIKSNGKEIGTIAVFVQAQEDANLFLPEEKELLTAIAKLLGDYLEREEAEQALRNSEQRYRTLAQNFPNGAVILFDHELRYQIADGLGLADLGLSSDEMEGKILHDIFPPDICEFLELDYRTALAGEEVVSELQFGERLYRTHTMPVRGERRGEVIAGMVVAQDITEQKRQEAALRESRQRYHQLIHNAPLGVAVFDRAGAVSMTNPVFRGLIQRQDWPPPNGFEDPFFTETGLADSIRYCVERGKRTVVEVSYAESQATSYQFRVHLAPLSLEEGEVVAVQALFEDVTQHRETERQRSHRQKLEAVGALAAGIAHEINTPTQFIGDNTHFLSDAFQDLLRLLETYRTLPRQAQDEARFSALLQELAAVEDEIDLVYLQEEIPLAIEQTLQGVSRVASIVNAMRTFAHPVTGVKSLANLNEALKHTLTVARNEYKYVADMETDLAPDLPLVSCDLGEINQVFLNLIVNAAHAIKAKIESDPAEKRGKIIVETRRMADKAVINIRDTGMGIPSDIESRIFDPFFTTKPVGEGTGQGLAIAHSIIAKKHGGQIGFESEVGKGTTFTLHLPIDPGESGQENGQSG